MNEMPGAWPLRTGSGGPVNADTKPSGGKEVGSPAHLQEEWSRFRRALSRIHRICIEEENPVFAATKAAEIAEDALMDRDSGAE
jgi:hypothetical protein